MIRFRCLFVFLLSIGFCWGASAQAADDAARTAEKILGQSGVQGGIVVHLGAGDGSLTAALAAGDGFTVHGLEADPAKVTAAQEAILDGGRYGMVSVEQFGGGRLPYTDNLVNLIVVEDAKLLSDHEILRVLAPEGSVCVREGERWTCVKKPRPADKGV